MIQQGIEQEIYRQSLIDYVKVNGGKSEQQAIAYLDENFQLWREASPPKAGIIEVKEAGEGNE